MIEVPGAADFDPAPLARLLRARGLIGAPDVAVERLAGGQSNPTYTLTSGGERLVLRKKPAGVLLASAHAVDREYRVLAALQASGVPVPRVHFYSDDVSIVGTPFYVMEFLDGRMWIDPALPGSDPDERRAIYFEMNRVLVHLHRVDFAAVGLAGFGKAGNYYARQIARWARQARESRTGDNPALDALAEWLPGHIPPGERTALVHGDYRLDNLVFHLREPRVIGVLDWELSTLGDPLADLAYNCLAWHIPPTLWRGIAGLDLAALGIPDEAAYVRRHAEASGNAGALEHWDFYIAYNLFRIAAIVQGIAKRALEGNAVAPDASDNGRRARPLAELGWRYAQRYDAQHG